MIPLGLQLFPAAVMIAILPFCPESPRWLSRKDEWEKAEKIMCDVRQIPSTHPYLVKEMRDIRAEVQFEAHLAALNPGFFGQFKDLWKKGIRNRIGIGLCLMM
jgi:hypothetical protein